MKIDKFCIVREDRNDYEFDDRPTWVYCVKDKEDDGYYAEFGKKKHAEFFFKAINSGKIR